MSRRVMFVPPAVVLALAACSLVTDLDGLANPAVDDAGYAASADGAAALGDASTGDPSSATDAAPLPDADLPPPPATCKADGLVCVPAAPTGWTGPFSLYEGGLDSTPSCAPGSASVLSANAALVLPPPATCAPCACSPAAGWTCGKVPVHGAPASCVCSSPTTVLLALDTCTFFSGPNLPCGGTPATTAVIGESPASGGACAPVAATPTPTKVPAAWNVAALGCQHSVPSQVDCPTGDVCSSTPLPPFKPGHCVMKAGDVPACPGFPYSKRSVFYRGVSDTRDCGACSCGAPPESKCVTSAKNSDNSNCSDRPYVTAPTCRSWSSGGNFFNLKATATPPTDVICAASGGAPTGTVSAIDAVTVCCME